MPAGIDRASPWRAALGALVEGSPGRLAFAARLCLACVLATIVAETFRTPEPALTVYLVFFVNRPDRMSSMILATVMVILLTVILMLLLPLSILVLDYPFWRLTMMVALSFALVFLGSSSKLRPFSATLALLTVYVLDVIGTVPSGEAVTRSLLYAWLFIGIPAGVSIVVDLLVAPAPRLLATRAIACRLHAAAAVLHRPTARDRAAFERIERLGFAEIAGWLHLAAIERTSTAADMAALHRAAGSAQTIVACVALIDRYFRAEIPVAERNELAGLLDRMAGILNKGTYPVDICIPADDGAQLPPEARGVLDRLVAAISCFAEGAAQAQHKPEPSKKSGFFVPGAFSDNVHVHHALKTTAAAMTCYILLELWDWPGIHTALITCYIVSLGTAAETIEKLSLRVAGCLVGAGAGIFAIIYILPALTSITGLVIVVGIGTFAAGWVAAGSPRISYAGFQIVFAFLLCVLQGSGPGTDLVTARDRVVGILLGNLVTYVVFTRIWPVSVFDRVDGAVAALLKMLATLASTSAPARLALAGQSRAALLAIRHDVALTRFEPASLRPAVAWLGAREQMVHMLEELQAPLLIGGNYTPGCANSIAERLERLAVRVKNAGRAPPFSAAPEPVARSPDCDTLAEPLLAALEDIVQREYT